MRRVWIGVLVLCASAAMAGGPPQRSAEISPAIRVVLDSDHDIFLHVKPHEGDAWTRLSLRITGDATRWKALAELNGLGENLVSQRAVRVPFSMARPDLQREAIRALFPNDAETDRGWVHQVVAPGPFEAESLWKIAEWFTGDGANYAAIRSANPALTLSTRRGDRIFIPRSVLSPTFFPKSSSPQIAEDDPLEEKDAATRGRGDTEKMIRASEDVTASPRPRVSASLLEYQRGGDRPYAVYRLREGEAIYSSVVIRFTGRVFSRDVNAAIDEVIGFNSIENVARLPVGYGVRIPMELLAPEHRPPDDPRRLEYEQAKRETVRRARRVKARNLEGVHVIIDPGHGGRDVGTVQKNLWESTYVYDVACRLKKELETKTAAKVYMTTRSRDGGYEIVRKNVLPNRNDHIVMTTPRYALENPVVGVNLRWYLANSIFRKALTRDVAPEKVIFISLHADSLHASLRGAMAYIPGNRHVQGSYTKTQQVYLARAEVQESPTVTQTAEEALEAEGLSSALAKSLIDSLSDSGLKVHPFSPVRDNVVRDGREWVPAIIRYNKVPTRTLLEICNLANEEDRRLLKTRKFRDEVATAISTGIVKYFVNQADVDRAVTAAK
jgi:N-acetylmuramoyl-L-alanine amidase